MQYQRGRLGPCPSKERGGNPYPYDLVRLSSFEGQVIDFHNVKLFMLLSILLPNFIFYLMCAQCRRFPVTSQLEIPQTSLF
jgi:hypothetical protein